MKNYGDYLSSIFPGKKVQKLSINGGFTCPNRDGTISTGGCIYCRNDSFTPSYCKKEDPVKLQLEKGKKFFSRKYSDMKYLAYFQSYSGTYNKSLAELEQIYSEALNDDEILGLVIATRPDCVNEEIFNLIDKIRKNKEIFFEIGAETSHNYTLQLINRNHTWEKVEETINTIGKKGYHCGIHLIAGLPGESQEMVLETVKKTVKLPVETIKLHQLQVLKDTSLYKMLETKQIDIPNYSLEEYLNLCVKILRIVPEEIIIERFLSQSPPDMVVSPSWRLKNYEFMAKLAKLIQE